MPRARYDVFISYRRADAALVVPLRDELQRMGYRVFFDAQSIEVGDDDWKKRVLRSVGASRTLVLCWSENASESPIVTFEYSSARALGKPVMPWMLDHTPLPVMLNHINGIHNPDVVQVAAALRPRLGRTLTARRRLQAALAGLVATVIVFALWFAFKPPPPPPPWDFSGEITEYIPGHNTGAPLSGVSVDVKTLQGSAYPIATTDSSGRFDLHLPQPQPQLVIIRLRKPGYELDEETVRTDKACDRPLTKLP